MRESDRLNPNFWPCTYCDGRGWYYDPADRDVIEGYKLAPRHKCGNCQGTGKGTKEAVKDLYDGIVADFRAKFAAWKEAEGRRKTGLRKLTQDEKKALGL